MGKNMSKKNIIFLFFLKFATFHSNFQEYSFINLKKKKLNTKDDHKNHGRQSILKLNVVNFPYGFEI